MIEHDRVREALDNFKDQPELAAAAVRGIVGYVRPARPDVTPAEALQEENDARYPVA